jgi:hypothetical protein
MSLLKAETRNKSQHVPSTPEHVRNKKNPRAGLASASSEWWNEDASSLPPIQK